MAEIVKTVDPNGGADYLSVAAFVAGEQGQHASSDTVIALCRRTGPLKDTSPINLGSFGAKVILRAHPDHRHGGKRGEAHSYILHPTGSTAYWLNCGDADFVLDGLEIEGSGDWTGQRLIHMTGYARPVITDCHIYGGAIGIAWESGNYNGTIERNIIQSSSTDILCAYGLGRTTTIRHNTLLGPTSFQLPLESASHFILYERNIARSYPTTNRHPDSNYNVATGGSTAPGTDVVQAFDTSALFPVAGDYRPAIPYTQALGVTWGSGAVPYLREYIVDTGGTEAYSSLNAAVVAAEQDGTDLAGANERVVFTCKATTGAADTVTVNIPNTYTTSAANNITIEAPEGHRHNGKWDYTKYRLEGAGVGIVVRSSEVAIKGLQIKNIGSGWATPFNCILTYSRHGTIIKNCILNGSYIYSGDKLSACVGIEYDSQATTYAENTDTIVRNSILTTSVVHPKTCGIRDRSYSDVVVENCSFFGLNVGYRVSVNVGNAFIRNTIFLRTPVDGVVEGYDGADIVSAGTSIVHEDSDYNISSDDTAPGANSLHNISATDLFLDPANGDFRLKADSPAIDAGTDLSQYFTADIAGTERPQGTGWDIGVFEYVEDGGGTEPDPIAGTHEALLDALTGISSGALLLSGESFAALAPLIGSASGAVALVGGGFATLEDLSGWAAGTIGEMPISGAHSALLEALTGSASGSVRISGAHAGILDAIVASLLAPWTYTSDQGTVTLQTGDTVLLVAGYGTGVAGHTYRLKAAGATINLSTVNYGMIAYWEDMGVLAPGPAQAGRIVVVGAGAARLADVLSAGAGRVVVSGGASAVLEALTGLARGFTGDGRYEVLLLTSDLTRVVSLASPLVRQTDRLELTSRLN